MFFCAFHWHAGSLFDKKEYLPLSAGYGLGCSIKPACILFGLTVLTYDCELFSIAFYSLGIFVPIVISGE